MEKITGTFLIKETYKGTRGQAETVIVNLEINYFHKKFDIKPVDKKQDSFFFKKCGTKEDYEMWKAVLKAIEKASDFAAAEIGLVNNIDCAK